MTTKTHRYTLYNLPVLSEMVLPELDSPEVFCQALDSPVIEGLKPVLIRQGPTIGISEIENKPWFSANGLDEVRLAHREFGELIIQCGEKIEIRMLADADEDLVRLYLLGSAMGCILHQRGIIPLHVSTVSINGQAWAFTASSGTGKSTLAARLHLFANCPMVSDDVAALYVIDGQPYVAGGPPLMKLSPELASVFDHASIIPIPHPESGKVKVQVNNSFVAGLVPVAGVVVLERDRKALGGSLEIEPLTGAEAFRGAREAIYRYQMGLAMTSKGSMFKRLAELTKRVPFWKGRLGEWGIIHSPKIELDIACRLANI